MKRSTWIILAVAAAAAVAAGAFVAPRLMDRGESEEVRTTTVERGTLRVTVTASGHIEPASEVDLSFDLPGRVAEVSVDLGDYVQAGQSLAVLETTDLVRAVTQAEINLRQAQLRLERVQEPVDEADIEIAEAAVSDAWAAYQVAQSNLVATEHSVSVGDTVRAAQYARDETYRTYQSLQTKLDEGGYYITESMVDAAHNAYLDALGQYNRAVESADLQMLTARNEVNRAYNSLRQAQNNLEQLLEGAGEADLEAAELDVAAAELALERAQDDLEKATMTAPFDGIVAEVNATVGEIASTGLPAVSLVDSSYFRINISVDEIDVSRLQEGLPVEVSVDALPDVVLTGFVERIGPAAMMDQGAIAYPVVIALDDTDAPLRVGMTATAVVMVEELSDQLLIPNWVVRIDQTTGQPYVYRQTADGNERVDIRLGIRYEGQSQILSGLAESDVLVLVQEEFNGFFGP